MAHDRYKWDGNTVDERDSEFRGPSTLTHRDSTYVSLSAGTQPRRSRGRKRERRRRRLWLALMAAAGVLALLAYLLLGRGRI